MNGELANSSRVSRYFGRQGPTDEGKEDLRQFDGGAHTSCSWLTVDDRLVPTYLQVALGGMP